MVPHNMRIKSHKVVAYLDESGQLLGWTGYRLGPERRGWQNYIDTLRKPFDIALLEPPVCIFVSNDSVSRSV